MRTSIRYARRTRQGGATLVIALLILVLIMMIGITAVTTSNTQYKLAGNLQFEDGAMNNAEAAVSAAENWLITSTNAVPPVPHYLDASFSTGATTGLLPIAPPVSNATLLAMTWSDSNSQSVAGNSAQRYIIQLKSSNNLLTGSSATVGRQAAAVCNKVNNYTITGRGTSARGAVKYVQSFYSVLACT